MDTREQQQELLTGPTDRYVRAMEKLVDTVQAISLARDLASVMKVVRTVARELTGADGATFVLRDGEQCYYADEDAISPLWKGQRFPLKTCISGWVMNHAEPAVIEDIYQDPRIPADAYRPTFVKSLAMVPIRVEQPIGAIGNYWATKRLPTGEELAILQALAHVTAVALENVDLYASLQDKVTALEASNRELAHFAWAAAHDLKTPLRGLYHLAAWIEEDYEQGNEESLRAHVGSMQRRVTRMEKLLDGILDYSGAQSATSSGVDEWADGETLMVDVRHMVNLPAGFRLDFSGDWTRVSLPRTAALRVLCNLIGNGVRHHDRETGRVNVAVETGETYHVIRVEDDGPGIPEGYRERIFEMFQTLKPRDETESSGMGLAIVRKILAAHGGDIAVEDGPRGGAVFRVTWPKTLGASR